MPIEATDPEPLATVAARLVPSVAMRDYRISDSSIVIGSSETADVRDTDRSVQPRHARLSHESGRWYLEDLNSTSGTFLNGRRIEDRVLVVHGDRVRCGTSCIELTCELVERAPAKEPHDGLMHELEQLRARIEAREQELRARDQRIGELLADNGELRAALELARKDLAGSRERHEAAVAELRHQLAGERQELAELARLHDQSIRDLSEAQRSIAELRQIIDARQGEDHHG